MSSATDLDVVAGLVYDTDAYLFPLLFGSRGHALPILKKLIQLDANSFSHRYIQVYEAEGVVQAILIGYNHREINKEAEEADFKSALPLVDLILLVPKLWILRPFMDKSDVTGHYIQNVCVAPEHRGKGIGSLLIRNFCETHATDVWLDVELGNKAALQLYERLGFRVSRQIPIFLPGLGSYRLVRHA